MKTIKEINKLVARKGGCGATDRGYGRALEDVLGLINEICEPQHNRDIAELKKRING